MERILEVRRFFAHLVTANAGIPPGSELEAAFASTPREQFVGPPPWKVFTAVGYIETTSGDPTFLYQDVVVSLGTPAPLNNGQPTLHAHCIHTLGVKKGDQVVHVGAGSGYYTTILSKLVGDTGRVDAYEIEPELAQRASANLAVFSHVRVHCRSGATEPLPACDVIYVNAGATEPIAAWLDALHPGGRLLFPLTPAAGAGAMLLITKHDDEPYPARFLMQVQFVPCVGARIDSTANKLAKAFRNRNWDKVKSLYRNNSPDRSCWCSGEGWWLSTN
ncbi:protein-L-isoaspartate O-methyltransferase family protein [Acidicapsa acidisoli]|uniref:protein-L-isoaspartate O-methyltransferase family protein n=1 Tax=Acidicapsa acidisoli TaxID=1615681 RepID=UPI0021E08CB4|nr:protein-L-isoaspartate(D-aspartate) O-methyltransferase [Acidicapsa acidisoli]